MDCEKIGKLIAGLRKEKGMTQKALAQRLFVSDRAVSKWERGLGCPEVSLLPALSCALEVDLERMLAGELSPNSADGGNMKRIKFYVCPQCGNILTATGQAAVTCCGRKLTALISKPADEAHALRVEPTEDEYYITFSHPMEKEHYISFVAYVSWDRLLLARLYPEQGAELRIPQLRGGTLYFGCNRHGLYVND